MIATATRDTAPGSVGVIPDIFTGPDDVLQFVRRRVEHACAVHWRWTPTVVGIHPQHVRSIRHMLGLPESTQTIRCYARGSHYFILVSADVEPHTFRVIEAEPPVLG